MKTRLSKIDPGFIWRKPGRDFQQDINCFYTVNKPRFQRPLWSGRWEGGSREEGRVYTYGWFMLIMAEANTTLQSNYPPIRNNFFK